MTKMMNNFYVKVDKYLKIILLFLAKITIIGLAISSFIFVILSKESIEEFFLNDEITKTIFLNFKEQAKILIWFVTPLAFLSVAIDIYKIYTWLYE